MNILWLSHFIPYPPKGGNLQRSFNLLREVAEKNQVFLLAFNQKSLLPTEEQLSESVRQLRFFCSYVQVFDIPCERSGWSWIKLLLANLLSPLPYSTEKFHSEKMAEAVQTIIRNHQIDLVHFDTVALAEFGKSLTGGKKVLNHHNIESALLLSRARRERHPLKRFYLLLQGKKLSRYESKTYGEFDLNMVVSEMDKDRLTNHSPKAEVEVIPNGVDTGYFTVSNARVRKNNLVFAGGMNWFPNRDAVLYFSERIWPLVKKEIPEVSFTLIGSAPPKKVADMGKKEKIEVLGFVDDVRPYLARAAAYVVPLRAGGGTRLKILDAFACGKAVVSTSIGCEGLDVTPGRNILIGDSPGEFAEQVIRVCTEGDLMISLGREGRKLVEERYSWKTIGDHLNRTYENLIQKTSSEPASSKVGYR
jgi:sugar transferase (PEP-CTERM/EpsH1 system associated)